jgi:hypothetical protein
MAARNNDKGRNSTKRRKSAPLKASHQATRNTQPKRGGRSPRARPKGDEVSAGERFDANRFARAYLELPLRMLRCRSPFDVYREQTRFVQECFAGYAQLLAGSRIKTRVPD